MHNRDVWVFLFFAGVFIFNWPALEIANRALPLYIFGAWACYILLVRLFTGTGAGSGEDG